MRFALHFSKFAEKMKISYHCVSSRGYLSPIRLRLDSEASRISAKFIRTP